MRLWILDIFKLNRFIEILEFLFLMHKYQILDIDETCRKCITFDSVYSTSLSVLDYVEKQLASAVTSATLNVSYVNI